jgi:hypothetical protein
MNGIPKGVRPFRLRENITVAIKRDQVAREGRGERDGFALKRLQEACSNIGDIGERPEEGEMTAKTKRICPPNVGDAVSNCSRDIGEPQVSETKGESPHHPDSPMSGTYSSNPGEELEVETEDVQ